MRRLLAVATLATAAGASLWLIRHHQRAEVQNKAPAGAPQLEVGDILSRPDGTSWPTGPDRTIVIVTSGTCAACSIDKPFEDLLCAKAAALGVPVVFLISSRSEQNAVAHQMRADGKQFLREDLHLIGVNRTPTELAIDKTGRVLAIQVGTASLVPSEQEQEIAELLFGASRPRYSRISGTDLPVYAARAAEYQIIELPGRKTLRVAGLRYREIPMDDLWVRAAHEIDRTATVFVDCDSARSANTCQTALLVLSHRWGPDRLFAVNMPTRGAMLARRNDRAR